MNQEAKVLRLGLLALAIGLILGLGPAARAQTNIDEGKSPAQVFASDCAVCHKAPRGLAKGRGAGGIADFLRQHYTASREQAASLAAYILGAGSDSATAPPHGRKPPAERTARPAEEPAAKPTTRQTRRPSKPEEAPGPAAKLQQPGAEEEARPETEPIAVEEPPARPSRQPRGRRPTPAEQREPKTSAAARGRPAVAPSPEPAPQVSEPVRIEPSAPAPIPAVAEPTTTAASPPAQPNDVSPVPRDDIPD